MATLNEFVGNCRNTLFIGTPIKIYEEFGLLKLLSISPVTNTCSRIYNFKMNLMPALAAILNLFYGSATCQEAPVTKGHFLKSATFCDPFVSELSSHKVSIELNYASNSEVYDMACSGNKYKVFQNTNLGIDLPFYTKVISRNQQPVYGYSFSAPISFHLWWDPFEESTSPVLNTSYKFSPVNFKFIRFYNYKIIRNISFKIAPFNHESTHIGDELALFKNNNGSSITRINVSYAYSEMNITLNDPNGSNEQGHSWRFGWKYRVNGAEGFYTANKANSDTIIIPSGCPKSEYYIQYNFIRNRGFLTSPKWVNIISLEIRNQIRYQYDELHAADERLFQNNSESKRVVSANAYIGWKVKHTETVDLGIYLHGYAGLNPYGQFRNHAGFESIGLSFIID